MEITRRDRLPSHLDIEEESMYNFFKFAPAVQKVMVTTQQLPNEMPNQIYATWKIRMVPSILQLSIDNRQDGQAVLPNLDILHI